MIRAVGEVRAAGQGSDAGATAPSVSAADVPWHARPAAEVARELGVDPESGLADEEAARRLQAHGSNELVERGGKAGWRILREQVTATMVLILIGAAVVKMAVAVTTGDGREWIDAAAIAAIVVLNVALGFTQEYRAERAMAALRQMASPAVQVRRGGRRLECLARDLVPGDLVLLEAGSVVPADARLMTAAGFQVLEAALTGESAPVDKRVEPVEAGAALGDRHSLVHLGTHVSAGRATAVVVATGMRTELGRVATLLQQVQTERTPLQRRVAQLGAGLAAAALVVIGGMVALGVWRGESLADMLLAGVAVAVAAIPEGLPAVMTITLALGAQRMLTRRALIRRLPAVETLGSVTTICSDKTGTLTENRMQVVVLDAAGHEVDFTEPTRRGHPVLEPSAAAEALPEGVSTLLAVGVLCNDASLAPAGSAEARVALGDPTEGAIVVAGAARGLTKVELDSAWGRVAEAPFTSERKRMTTVHRVPAHDEGMAAGAGLRVLAQGAPYLAAIKGSADGLLTLTTAVLDDGVVAPLTPELRARIQAAMDGLARRGLRVLGVAARPVAAPSDDPASLERDVTFIGLIGLLDPPRLEVKDAVARCREAGIRPVMITGDHPLTALEVARQLGIAGAGDVARTGAELEQLDDAALRHDVGRVAVFARVAPEHKLRIVEALQRQGEVVAMTGDGVNDAPALRKADIGVAMGITGTDVSKEASDMVITDDNFATIVRAVEEGRTIYDNVRKFVKYIVTSNSAEVLVMFLAQAVGMPTPMTTLQILWMNLVTDGVPGLALGLEPTEPGTMRRAPFAPDESVFSRGIGRHIVLIGLLLTAVAFGVGWWAWQDGRASWGTMVFMTLTLAQLGHAMAVRSHGASLFAIGIRGNPLMLGALVVTLVLQLGVVYVPAGQRFFGTVPLTGAELLLCLVASSAIFWAVEGEKWLVRRAQVA